MEQFFLKCAKTLIKAFCLISPEIRSLIGWSLSPLKPDLKRYVLSAETFFRDICGLRYSSNNSKLLMNYLLSVYFDLFSKILIRNKLK